MDFLELLEKGDFKTINGSFTEKEKITDHASEYNNGRDIRDTQVGKRPDKIFKKETIPVTKIPIPFQRQIVRTASTFLFGSPISLVEITQGEETKNDAYNGLIDAWDAMRMDSTLLKFCKAVKSETEASIVFFAVKSEADGEKAEIKLKSRLLTSENGAVYPIFDAFGDLIAFNWKYSVKEGDKDIPYWYIWTVEKMYAMKDEGSDDWQDLESYPQPNLFKKIPVVYMTQSEPEWWEVQDLIDSFEMSFSKFVDTNAYFASPMYKVKGAVKSMPSKDEIGKMVKLDIIETDKGNIIEADLDVISWDRAPESLKLEFEINKDLIYGLTDTPDLSFNNVKGIGNVSGIALKLMFLGSILKAKEGEGDFKIAISRIVNVIKAGIGNIIQSGLKSKLDELKVDITFTSILPENLKEIIEQLSEASAGKAIMSQRSAVSYNPLIDDVEKEMETIEEEANAEAVGSLGETQNL